MVDGGQWVTLPIIACMCVAVYAFVYACVSQCGCVSAFLSSHAGASPGTIPFHHLKLGHAPATLSDTRVFAAQASVPKAFHHKLCSDGAWHELCGIARAPQGADTASSSVGTASSSVGSFLGRFQTCTVAAADVPLRVRVHPQVPWQADLPLPRFEVLSLRFSQFAVYDSDSSRFQTWLRLSLSDRLGAGPLALTHRFRSRR